MNSRKFKNWMRRVNYVDEFGPKDSTLIQQALNGDIKKLGGALSWVSSPQIEWDIAGKGHFWAARAEGKERLSKRTRQFLAKLRDEAKRRGC